MHLITIYINCSCTLIVTYILSFATLACSVYSIFDVFTSAKCCFFKTLKSSVENGFIRGKQSPKIAKFPTTTMLGNYIEGDSEGKLGERWRAPIGDDVRLGVAQWLWQRLW